MHLSDATKKDTPYTWIATRATLQKLVDELSSVRRIAVDIEADSLYHYFEKVCLIQISTDSITYVLDPLALQDLSPLAPVMADPEMEKVFHAASYDILCLRRDYGFSFASIFDTHVAAQLLGYPQLGLSALLESLLGVAHSKRFQREDWSRRPLSSEHLQYAAMDTHYLLALRDLLEQQLREKGRLEWAREEFEIAAAIEIAAKEFDTEGFRRIKGSRELSVSRLAVLRALYLLRERYAREMDLPPFKILQSSVLLDLARRPPESPHALHSRRGISPRVANRFGKEICQTIQEALSEDPSFLMLRPRASWKPPSHEARERLERLKSWRQVKAQELGLHVGVVFAGTLLEIIAQSPPRDLESLEKIEGMRRWRVRQFGADLLELLS